mgnify:CR=1 FL=1
MDAARRLNQPIGEIDGRQRQRQQDQPESDRPHTAQAEGGASVTVVQLAAGDHLTQVRRGLAVFLIPPGALAIQVCADL